MQRVAGHDGIDALPGRRSSGRQDGGRVLRERLAERLHPSAGDRQAGRGAMAAVAQEVRRRGVQPAEQVEGRDGAPRAGALVAVEGDQDGRAVMALGDPRRDDPDHARVPAVGGEHEGRRVTRLRHLRLGLEPDAGLDVLALRVRRVELRRDGAGAVRVRGQQQLEPRVGAVQPPGGVDARREPEPDGAGVDAARVHARDLHERLQAGLARRGERAETGAHEAPVLVHEGHDVGHGRERDEVEIGLRRGRVQARRLEQRLRELVRHAGRAELRARVPADRRVDDGRVGQPAVGARRVVVGHHHGQAGGARGGDLVHRGDRAVHRHEQFRPAGGEALDGGEGEAVAVVDPARQVPVDRRPERAQRPHQHGGGADAVDVVVPVHGDTGPARHMAADQVGGVPEAAEGVQRVRDLGGEEPARRLDVRHPAAHEDLRGGVREPECGGQSLGGGKVVGRDLEADVDRHGAGRYARGWTEPAGRRYSKGEAAPAGRPRRARPAAAPSRGALTARAALTPARSAPLPPARRRRRPRAPA